MRLISMRLIFKSPGRIQPTVLLLGTVLWCTPTSAFQSEDDPNSAASTDTDVDATHDEIRELRDGLIAAVTNKDVDALVALAHEDVVLTAQAGAELQTVRGRDGVRNYVDQLLTGPDAGVSQLVLQPTVDELTILHGDDTGIAFGSSTDHYVLRDGTEFDLQTRWSSTIVTDNGEWKLASLHVSSNLFDNPVLAAQSFVMKVVAAALGIAGLAVGVFLGRRKSSSPATAE